MLGILFRLGNLRAERTAHATAGRNHYGDPNPEEDRGQTGSLLQGARGHPNSRKGSNELEANLRRMACLMLWEKSWTVCCEEMVMESVTEEVDQVYASTSGADRIDGMRNCEVGFTGSSREEKI